MGDHTQPPTPMSKHTLLGQVRAVLTGTIRPLGDRQVPSAIDKQPRYGPQQVRLLGLTGDEQADRRVHGGIDKAVHCYAWSHYAWWQERYPQQPLFGQPGAFGENLSLDGITEDDVCIGDILQIGSASFAVSQGRQPCFKLNLRFGIPDMAMQVQDSLRAGWYLRVLQEGSLQAGDGVYLLERNWPDYSVARLLALIRDRETRPKVLEPLLQLPLPESWRKLFARRLEVAEVEDWGRRMRETE